MALRGGAGHRAGIQNPPAGRLRSFSESCGDLAKGRKSTKVAGGARASGYNNTFPGSKTSISLEKGALHAPGNRTHKSGLCLKQRRKMKPPKRRRGLLCDLREKEDKQEAAKAAKYAETLTKREKSVTGSPAVTKPTRRNIGKQPGSDKKRKAKAANELEMFTATDSKQSWLQHLKATEEDVRFDSFKCLHHVSGDSNLKQI